VQPASAAAHRTEARNDHPSPSARAADAGAGLTTAAPIAAPARPPTLGLGAIATLVALCFFWGLNQVTVKIALADYPPFTQMALRSGIAALIVMGWCVASGRGRLFERDGTLWPGLLAGFLFGTEFLLLYVGLQWTAASRGTLFCYSAPIWVALGAWWLLPAERLAGLQWLGLALCMLGVAIVLGVPLSTEDGMSLLGDLLTLGAGLGWAATTLVIKASRLRAAPFEKVLFYQLAVGAAMGIVGAIVLGERMSGMPSLMPTLALAYQTVWVAGVTYLVWFRMVAIYPASQLQASTATTPVFGVLAGWIVLGEPLSPAFALGALLEILGLVLVTRPRRDAARS
jgi:drug/metabolite transporter (DMT)-like permease